MARLSFGEAFAPGIKGAADQLSDYFVKNAEDKRKKAEEEKAQREQASILSQLIGGGYPNKVQPSQQIGAQLPQQEGLSPQHQGRLLSRLTTDNYNKYQDWQKQNTPKQQETVKVGNNLYLENPNIKNMPYGDPIFTEPQTKVTEDFIDAGSIDGLEQFKDYKVNRIVTENPDGTKTVKYGQPFTWKKQNININNGDGSTDLSKETTAILNKYQKDQQDLMAKLEAVKKGESVYETTPWGFKTVVSAQDLTTKLSSLNTQYQQFLKNNVDVETLSDWNNLKGTFVQNNPQSEPTIWNTILQNYKNGNKDEAWFKEQIHLFTSEYGYNPLSKFGYK